MELVRETILPGQVPENLTIGAVLELAWIETRQVTNPTMVEMLQDDHELDQGEAEAITLAFELQAQRLLYR